MTVPTTPRSADQGRSFWLLIGCLALCFTPTLAGWTFPPDAWFRALRKPGWMPPNWLFGPVWTLLYLSMGVALYRVAKLRFAEKRFVLSVFALQLLLNAAWTPVHFGAQEIGWALAVIFVLDLVVAATVWLFWRIDRMAGALLIPYLGWILFATALNGALWSLNPGV